MRHAALLGQALAVLCTTLIAGGVLAVYLAVTGSSPSSLHAIVDVLGKPFAAQRTEHIDVSVQVFPDSRRLSAITTLTLHSLEDQRRRFFFLLNPLLKLHSMTSDQTGGDSAISVYRLSWLMMIESKEPIAKDRPLKVTLDYEGTFPADIPDPLPTEINPHHVALGPESFWYPIDAQSFFTADVRVTLPRRLTLAHNSSNATRTERGDLQTVHWASARPIAAIPIVAGEFQLTERLADGTNYRVYVADDVALDTDRILEHMAHANRFLSDKLGDSGFDTISTYISRDLRRGVNYGNGLIGMSLRYFRSGDDGFAFLAHEIAHNWWGASVAEQWLRPGTGGQWIVEGLAELSSLMATEEAFGANALTRRLASEFFDPARQQAIRGMSMLDNVLTEASTRDTIYRKGSYVAFNLCSQIGRDSCYAALRQFVAQHRYQQATDVDLQKAFEETSGRNLDAWFADWVRSDALADLKLVSNGSGEVTIQTDGKAQIDQQPLPLWIFADDASAPTVTSAPVGDKLTVQPGQHLILDPLLSLPDISRANNRYPQAPNALYVAADSNHKLLLTNGEPWPWSPQTLSVHAGGARQQSWELQRGMLQPPAWFPDGSQILVSYSDPDHSLPTILAFATDGTRRTLGRGTSPAVASDGSVYAARKGQVIRIAADASTTVVAQRCGWAIDQPLPSPDHKRIAYVAARHNHVEIRVAEIDGSRDRVLITWDRDRTLLRWAPAGDKLYAVLGGNWDWQLWEIPLDESAARVVVRDAAAIGDFAISPDGTQIALTATPEKGYPLQPKQLFVLSLDGQPPRQIDVPGADLDGVSWDGSDTLLATGNQVPAGEAWLLPRSRLAKVVSLSDTSVHDLPLASN